MFTWIVQPVLKFQASCYYASWFVSDLFRNPLEPSSGDEAQILCSIVAISFNVSGERKEAAGSNLSDPRVVLHDGANRCSTSGL